MKAVPDVWTFHNIFDEAFIKIIANAMQCKRIAILVFKFRFAVFLCRVLLNGKEISLKIE